MKILLCLLMTCSLAAMHRQSTEVSIASSSSERKTPESSISEEDELCDFALSHVPTIGKFIRPFLKELIQSDNSEPVSLHHSDSIIRLKKIKSGEEPLSPDNNKMMQDMLMQAIEKSLHHHDNVVNEQQRIINDQYSKRTTIIVAGITSIASALITALTTIYSK